VRFVVGLGNPGPAYARTRHNAGFEVADELARRHGGQFRRLAWLRAETAEVDVDGRRMTLVKPMAFMNLSGGPVASLARRKGVAPGDVLAVVDDVDLPAGRLRLRPKGGAGGHNGLKSLIERLGTEEFPRLRVGVGRPADRSEMVGHVLSRFTPVERAAMDESLGRAADAVELVWRDGLERAMNVVNGRE
jgi:peptidyl-tRNA hydrolase, PTH1 family